MKHTYPSGYQGSSLPPVPPGHAFKDKNEQWVNEEPPEVSKHGECLFEQSLTPYQRWGALRIAPTLGKGMAIVWGLVPCNCLVLATAW